MNKLLLFLIRLYQKYLSPKKGYCCAYGSLHNSGSCSERVYNIIKNNGVINGWADIKHQFKMCSEAYEIIKEKNNKKVKKKKNENDWCSPIDICDVISYIPIPKRFCKGSAIDGGCDLPCDCSF